MLFSKALVLRTLRCKNRNVPGVLGRLTSVIGDEGAFVGEIKTISMGGEFIVRDIDVFVETEEKVEHLLAQLKKKLSEDVRVLEVRDDVLSLHQQGKIEVRPKIPITTIHQLRRVYTPGVANVSKLIAGDESMAQLYTWAPRTVAICTNGSRVLGLGNIGPVASLPVMEGKAALLCQFTGLNAVPILINTRNPDKFVETVLSIEKGFGAIHLEDIETPVCFEIEQRLIEALEKPVMHDDQHGTAVAALAAFMSACKKTKKKPAEVAIGQIGLGAAGLAIARLLMAFLKHPLKGTDLDENAKKRFVGYGGQISDLNDIMATSDVVISTTGVPGLIKKEKVRKGQIILALSNPYPEIEPEDALAAGAALATDGRFVNNLLGYPGIWLGALDAQAKKLSTGMYMAAAHAIADLAPKDELLPSPLEGRVHAAVARAVAQAAEKEGLARSPVDKDYMKAKIEG